MPVVLIVDCERGETLERPAGGERGERKGGRVSEEEESGEK